MGSLRRLLEWLRDLDARYGYVKRARVMPGDPAPVRLRKVADTSEVVLVNPTTRIAPPPLPLAPLPDVDADATGPIQVVFAPSVEEVDGYADVEDQLEAEEESELEAELAATDEPAQPTTALLPAEPHAPHPDAINRLRTHHRD